jgi:hypothetical protein
MITSLLLVREDTAVGRRERIYSAGVLAQLASAIIVVTVEIIGQGGRSEGIEITAGIVSGSS